MQGLINRTPSNNGALLNPERDPNGEGVLIPHPE